MLSYSFTKMPLNMNRGRSFYKNDKRFGSRFRSISRSNILESMMVMCWKHDKNEHVNRNCHLNVKDVDTLLINVSQEFINRE